MAVEPSQWHFTSLCRKSKARGQLLPESSSRFVAVGRRDPFRKGLPGTWLVLLVFNSVKELQDRCSAIGRYLHIMYRASNKQTYLAPSVSLFIARNLKAGRWKTKRNRERVTSPQGATRTDCTARPSIRLPNTAASHWQPQWQHPDTPLSACRC